MCARLCVPCATHDSARVRPDWPRSSPFGAALARTFARRFCRWCRGPITYATHARTPRPNETSTSTTTSARIGIFADEHHSPNNRMPQQTAAAPAQQQPANQPTNQSTNQPTNLCHDLRQNIRVVSGILQRDAVADLVNARTAGGEAGGRVRACGEGGHFAMHFDSTQHLPLRSAGVHDDCNRRRRERRRLWLAKETTSQRSKAAKNIRSLIM